MSVSNRTKQSDRLAILPQLTLAFMLIWGGCVSDGPSYRSGSRAHLQTNRVAAIPPRRLPSDIAPPPQSAFEPGTNRSPSGVKSLHDGLADLKTAPPQPEKLYAFTAKDLEVKDALALFARNNELNIVPDPDISGQVTVDTRNLTLEKSMEAILDTFGYYADIDRGLIRVRKMKTDSFTIDYVRLTRSGNGNTAATISSGSNGGGGGGGGGGAQGGGGAAGGGGDGASVSISKSDSIKFWEEMEEQLKSLLSPAGKLAVNRMVGNIMVTDQKANVDRISTYVKQIKRTLHLQVDLEAQIYEVVFDDEFHLGIDWQNVMGSVEKWAISSGGSPVGIASSRLIVDSPIGGLTPGAPALCDHEGPDQGRARCPPATRPP